MHKFYVLNVNSHVAKKSNFRFVLESKDINNLTRLYLCLNVGAVVLLLRHQDRERKVPGSNPDQTMA